MMIPGVSFLLLPKSTMPKYLESSDLSLTEASSELVVVDRDRRAIQSVRICLSRDLCVTVGLVLKRARNPSDSPVVKERKSG